MYLCMLLSKNELFSSRVFWTELIEKKVNKLILDNNLNSASVEKGSDKNLFDFPPLVKEGKNILNGMKSAFKNFFKNEEDQINENKLRSQKNLEKEKLFQEQKFKKQSEVFNVLKEFIPHFANFDFDVSLAIDIIVEEATKYEFSKDKISFFVTYLNSSVFTIKNNKFYKNAIKTKGTYSFEKLLSKVKHPKLLLFFIVPPS